MSDLYPLRTEPAYRHYIWGGDRLHALLGKPLGPDGTLAESWEVADEARVANGPLAGRTLREVDEASGGELTGDAPRYPKARLPLLIKLSDARTTLSVQIHPNDEQALHDEPARGQPGKAEMYVILEAAPDAGLYWGLRPGVTAADLERACRTGQGVAESVGFFPLHTGDVLYSAPGVVHALGAGIVYCEVQQNSDITYRLYDWGRLDAEGHPRPLHLERALAVLAPPRRAAPLIRPLPFPPVLAPDPVGGELRGARQTLSAPAIPHPTPIVARTRRNLLCACPHFAVELLELEEAVSLERARRAMRAVVVLEGAITLHAPGCAPVRCGVGQSTVIPAALPETFAAPDGMARLLLVYVPDLAVDIIAPLQAAGQDTARLGASGDSPLV